MVRQISRTLAERIRVLAAADPGREVCGLLLGAGEVVTAILPAANVAANPARAFEVDPAVLLAAHRAARDGGPAVLGCYHSHPNGVARPSARDAAAAQPGQLWLIVAAREVRLFRFDPGGFVELPAPSGCHADDPRP
ncbi:Mov34/MPN/PAD-1 family protein [Sphingomonas jatrophae]|uniref:Proteasome lid subunit RPN8/RPN11, contains Jab1/MPN metalloenzyme (JAMM) motif n=1 Tax=Sphingomonas jatrophae TaxID=1166337 RepID=A0A1I6L251_9SPHN|nr:M67 family metallopeptidase [Sphingomonas jatrophae]SFR97290.1 Proteasome lid subunit RPN8/RPN11, contains Jab1/MPN metalloenzyme (JAMM) motif [Sphingomonas jatrophae]